MNVERVNVMRLVERTLADGLVLVIEGVDYRAECGCVVAFGKRLDDGETTCGYDPCEQHRPSGAEFLAEFGGPDAPEIPTEDWMAILLARTG